MCAPGALLMVNGCHSWRASAGMHEVDAVDTAVAVAVEEREQPLREEVVAQSQRALQSLRVDQPVPPRMAFEHPIQLREQRRIEDAHARRRCRVPIVHRGSWQDVDPG